MILKRYTLLVVMMIYNIAIATSKEFTDHYGLSFHSHEVNQDERTGMILAPEPGFNFKPGFSFNFELSLQKANLTYGYVCRIVSDDIETLDLVANLNVAKMNFILYGEDGVISNQELQEKDVIVADTWLNVNIAFSSREIICNVGGKSLHIPHAFRSMEHIKIFMGCNEHPVFVTTDVPPMSIRNLKLLDDKNKLVACWTLDKHRKDHVYDEVNNIKALVLHGIWNIEEYVSWEKKIEMLVSEKNAQIATDTERGRIFIATSDSLYIYHAEDGELQRVKTQGGAPFASGGSQTIYDPVGDRLVSYSILFPEMVTYDLRGSSWSSYPNIEGLAPIQHHNRFIDAETNTLVVFGGYGNHTFKANLACHSLSGGDWDIHSLASEVAPRFLSAAGYLGDGKFLLMGGFGSLSGKQEESPKNFNDLYEIDYKTREVRKLADIVLESEHRTLGNSLVVDKEGGKIYALTFSKEKFDSDIRLLSLDLNTFQQRILGEPIPYHFLDTESFADLFLYPKQQKLYAVVLNAGINQQYKVSVYSLRYPPLGVSEVMQEDVAAAKYPAWGIVLTVLAGGLALIGGTIWRNRKRRKDAQIKGVSHLPEEPSSVNPVREEIPEIVKEKQVSCIRLLGGFQVFSQAGEDITGSFSLITRQLFVFLLLHSIKDGKGITSQKIDETFWFGMDKASATNNRSVNVRKLRLILKEIGDITLVNENSYWHLNMGKDIVCDYYDAMSSINYIKKEKVFNQAMLEHLLDIVSAGSLLPNMNMEWTDVYKADFTDSLIDVLAAMFSLKEIENDPKLLLAVVETILLHDTTNEEAIKVKCRTLYQQGQKGLSKQAFERFSTAYMNMLNEKPAFEYQDIIK